MKSRVILIVLLSFLTSVMSFAQPGNGQRQGGQYGGGYYRGGYQSGQRSHGSSGWVDPKMAYIRGSVTLLPDENEEKQEPGVGVVVTVITAKDTLHTTVGETGRFRMFNIPPGKAKVTFSMLGYGEETNNMTLKAGENSVVAYLRPQKFEIQEAVHEEDVAPVSVNGDTVIFNAAAVKVNKGENAIDILEQMPGVEVGESGVKVLNEDVKTVYIDGSLLFGEAPMRALNNLPAEEVVHIKSYQEYANKDPYHKISNNESKQRVLDVKTKHKPRFFAKGELISGGGFDTDSTYHKFRYTLGGNAGLFSEKLQAFLNANVNNINDPSNNRRGNSFRQAGGGGSADLRGTSVSAGVNRSWMSPKARNFVLASIGGSYSYSDKYQVDESITERIYFPTDKYESRRSDSKSWSDGTDRGHNFSLSAEKALRDGRIKFDASYNLTEGADNSISSSYNKQDDLAPQGNSSSRHSTSNGKSYSTNISARKRFQNKFGLNFKASYSESDNNNHQSKIDTTTSTITRTVIDIAGTGSSRNYSFNPSASWEIDDNRSISAGYSFSDRYQVSERVAYDVTDPLIASLDSVNTYTYVTANKSHSAHVNYRSYLEPLDAVLSINVPWSTTLLNRDETFPKEDYYNRRFNSFNPSMDIGNQSQINHWSFKVSSSGNAPSLNEVRPKINNSNLYSVSAGNPDLKQSRSFNTGLTYSTVLGAEMRQAIKDMEDGVAQDAPKEMKKLSTFSWEGSFSMTHLPIVNRRIYYTEETYLPAYGYTMPAQSTFSTYENAPNSYSASTSAKFDLPLEKIQWLLNTSLSFSWDSNPTYVNYNLTRTQNFRPSLRVGMRSNFSRNVRLNINCNASYVYSDNSQQDKTSYFVERLNFGWELNNVFKYFYAGGNYLKSFTQGLFYGKINDNIMNINAGFRCGPRNNFSLAVSVNDVFNKNTGFSTSMNADYINNRWNHNFGRFVLFTLTYHFTKMKGGNGWIGGRGQGGFGGGNQGGNRGGGRGGFGGGYGGGFGGGYGGGRR